MGLAFHQSIRMDPVGIYAWAPYDTEVRGEKGAVVTGRPALPGFHRDAEDQLTRGRHQEADGVPAAGLRTGSARPRTPGWPT